MAMSSIGLRRAISISTSFIKHHWLSYSLRVTSNSPLLSSLTAHLQIPNFDLTQPRTKSFHCQSRNFRSTSLSLSSSTSPREEEIGPKSILFEGCDYNHWLITMNFPQDPAPTREEMIETYLQTIAKVVGSYEEAKKKMYAFSTTTYQGFNCLVTEEESEKFKGLPGVVFVLPDSYSDPVNKEYGGDKYENGVITPRPPPVQYRSGGRFDRNRDNLERPVSPASDVYKRDFIPMKNYPGGRGPASSYQNEQRYNNPSSGSFPQGQRDIRGDNRNYGPPQGAGGNIRGSSGNYAQGQGRIFPQGQSNIRGDSMNYSPPQGVGGNSSSYYVQGTGGNSPRGPTHIIGDNRNYGPPQGAGGNIGQPAGNYVQGPGGNFPQGQSHIRRDSYVQGPGGNFPKGPNTARGDSMNYGALQGVSGTTNQPAGFYAQGPGENFPQGQSHFRGDSMNYRAPQGAGGNIGQPAGNYAQGPGGNFPKGQNNITGHRMNYGPPQGAGGNIDLPVGNYGQRVRGSFLQGQRDLRDSRTFINPYEAGGYQGQSDGYYGQSLDRRDGHIAGENFPREQRGPRGDHMRYGHPQGHPQYAGGYQGQPAGNFGHQAGRGDGHIAGGNFPREHRDLRGDHMRYGHPQGPGAPTGSQAGAGYGQNYSEDGQDHRFQQMNNTQGEKMRPIPGQTKLDRSSKDIAAGEYDWRRSGFLRPGTSNNMSVGDYDWRNNNFVR